MRDQETQTKIDDFTRRLQPLVLWRDGLAKDAEKSGEQMFLGKPDAWYEKPHFGCCNGHVSHSVLKSECYGGDMCMACGEWVILIPPMSEEDFTKIAKSGFPENREKKMKRLLEWLRWNPWAVWFVVCLGIWLFVVFQIMSWKGLMLDQ